MAHDPSNLIARERDPEDVPKIWCQGHRFRGYQFRIVFGILRETLMIHMECAKVYGRNENEKAEHRCHDIVDAPAPKGSAVDRLMKSAK